MSFGAFSGWAITGAAAAIAAVVSYIFFMKVKHPRVLVPSLLLWRRVLDEDRDVSFWEKVRKAVSLAIAILVPLLIVFALGRPERASAGATAGPLTIVIDSSLSMLAERPGGRTRWDAATSRAIALAGDDEVTILTTADGIVAGPTTDRELLRASLDDVKPAEPGPFPQVAADNQVVFLTDGVTPYDVPSSVRVESVFAAADNAAITAFDVRRDFRSRGRYEAYVEVGNFSAAARQVTLAVDLGSNRIYEQAVQIGPDEIVRQAIPFDAGAGGALKAELVGVDDALAEDDEAFAWVASARPEVVTLVTRRNPPLETLLGFDGGVTVNRIEPEAWVSGTGIVIFDRWAPDRRPSQPAIYIAPPATPWLAVAGAPERNATWSRADESHAAVRGVDGRTLRFDEVNLYDLKDWTPVAFTGRGNPLVAVRDAGSESQAIVTFDVTRGNIANDSAFPVLIGDLLAWFERTPPVRVQAPGAVRLPGDVTAMRREGGGDIALRRLGDVAIADLREPGVYIAERPAGQIAVAINAGSRASSNVRHSSRPQDAGAGAPRASSGLWIWLVAIALVLFAAEFYTWHRRITV
ncbi:MAG: VWA domain-containing protein [Acidobacteriota bacterium]|nr:VWA domain-containing protein [Acidobacteriota bacterium]